MNAGDESLGPLDPFFGDPNDPATLFAEIEPALPLSDEERADVAADLGELREFAGALSPRGIRGVVVDCGDCGEPHFFSWALMDANLNALLGQGCTHAHEPAFEPDPHAFVSWDYARGYTDALTQL